MASIAALMMYVMVRFSTCANLVNISTCRRVSARVMRASSVAVVDRSFIPQPVSRLRRGIVLSRRMVSSIGGVNL